MKLPKFVPVLVVAVFAAIFLSVFSHGARGAGLALAAVGGVAATTNRWVRDGALSPSIALPAAGATATSAGIDFETPPGRLVDDFDIVVEVPATPSLADAHTITLTIVHSADNSTWVAVPQLAAQTITGGGGIGGPAFSKRFKLPDDVNEFVAIQAAVAASGGNNTAISATISTVF